MRGNSWSGVPGARPVPSPSAERLRTEPLTERVRRRDVRRFWASWSVAHPSDARTAERLLRLLFRACAWVVTPLGILLLLGVLVAGLQDGTFDDPEQLGGFLVFASLFPIAEAFFVWYLARTRHRRTTPERTYRLVRFALANGLEYLAGPLSASHLGPWRERGVQVRNVLRTTSGRPVEFGDQELVAKSTNARDPAYGGYATVQVGVELPHLVLRSRRNAVRRSLAPVLVPDADQRLGLEGDFDDHFDLLCPAGRERDALYLFTPDVMARFIDAAGDFDVELVEDRVFLTVPGDMVTLDPDRWRTVVGAVDAVTAKIDRWERWRDDDAPAPVPEAHPASAASAAARPARRGDRLRYVPGVGFVLLVLAMVAWFVIGFAIT